MKLIDVLHTICKTSPNFSHVSDMLTISFDRFENKRYFSITSNLECRNGMDEGKEQFEIFEINDYTVERLFTLNGDTEEYTSIDDLLINLSAFGTEWFI